MPAHELLSRSPVPFGLDQYIEHLSFGIHRTPKIHLSAADPDKHFVQDSKIP